MRLLNPEHEDYADVQAFFDTVVQPVIEGELGYKLTVVDGRQAYEHARIDQEIFAKLHRSSVVLADITGMRPNCFLELGYALGRELPTCSWRGRVRPAVRCSDLRRAALEDVGIRGGPSPNVSGALGGGQEPPSPRAAGVLDFVSAQREIFVSVDVETAGPIPGEYSLLSIGACDVYNEDRTFSCELKPINRNADPAALKVTGMSLDVLEETGLAPEEAMERFDAWATGLAAGRRLARLCGLQCVPSIGLS